MTPMPHRWPAGDPGLRRIHERPATQGETAPWPSWVSAELRSTVASGGIRQLWAHQAAAADALYAGHHVALATGTASGKTLGYLLPIMELTGGFTTPTAALGRIHAGASALYLAPTKALAHDQLRVSRELGPTSWRVSALDGDSAPEDRRYSRDFSRYVLTNPDMLHRSVLPNHQRWKRLLAALRIVVVDEAHLYRGTFGAQVSAVLRRLRRLCAHYGAEPAFAVVSATIDEPATFSRQLLGVGDVLEVGYDCSARGSLQLYVADQAEDPEAEARRLLVESVHSGRQTLTFVGSRRAAEAVASGAQRALGPECVAAYRGGYLADERRQIERGLQDGSLKAVSTTNALELGVDITGVDAVVVAGFPGSTAAFWQQVGRAGRGTRDALAVLVPRRDPLDQYLLAHAELLHRPDPVVVRPDNPHILGPQLAAAAAELPLTDADAQWFGSSYFTVMARMSQILRRRRDGWYWTRADRPVDAIDLRAIGTSPIEVIDEATGRVVGVVDAASVDRVAHPGAVYVHQGEHWLITDHDDGTALARRGNLGYVTSPVCQTRVVPGAEHAWRPLGQGRVVTGEVTVTSRVTGYLRRDAETDAVWDQTSLDLPQRALATVAVWFELAPDTLAWSRGELRAAAHATEHALTALLPAFVGCDRTDIAGRLICGGPADPVSVVVHDRHAGGAGYAAAGFARAESWLLAARQRIVECACASGCPSCVLTSSCDDPATAWDKQGAAALIDLLVGS